MKTSLVLLLLSAASANAQSPGAFAATGNMITPRFGHTATLLLNGKVLITGGAFLIVPSMIPINTAELYDPSTGTFTFAGDMTRALYWQVATLLPDGRVLIIGGDAVGSLGAELYDPSTGTFTPTGSMAASHGSATPLNNEKVLITGGLNAELYDPATGAFTATGAYADAGSALQLTTTLLADGRVLITGCGYYDDGYCEYVPADVGQLYDPATDAFSLTGGYGFRGGSTTLLTNGKVLFAGGATDGAVYRDAKLYDPSTGNFTRTGDMTGARNEYTATLLPDGRVLITGSRAYSDSDGHGNRSAELYDPSTGTFRSIGNMTARRGAHAATLLKDGRVLITGGLDINAGVGGGPPTNLSSAELYTPPVLVPAPALFSLSGDGQGQGAIWHAQTGQIASAGSPAIAGEVLSMYTTSLADGGVIPPQVAVGGRLAQVLYFGASGYPGYNQVNFRVPSGVAPGSAISVRLTYLSRPSNAVTIGVQ
jgi:hypothetical protein